MNDAPLFFFFFPPHPYILGQLNKSCAQFLVISFHRGLSVSALCVPAQNHVVELRGRHLAIVWRENEG